MKLFILYAVLFGVSLAQGDIHLSSGESTYIGGERVSCNVGFSPSVHCFCANSGCSTGYTSAGNVILNIVTTESDGDTSTRCTNYSSEASCLDAMRACN